MRRAVNTGGKNLDGNIQNAQRRANRSTTHIRIKKSLKFALEKWMRKHRCKTYSQAIKKLLEGS